MSKEGQLFISSKMDILRCLNDEQRLKYQLLVDRAAYDGYPEASVVHLILRARCTHPMPTFGQCVESIYRDVEGVTRKLTWPGMTIKEIALRDAEA